MHCTVLIPAYNTEQWISECLTSVCALKYPSFDFLVVDDGSIDRTASIAESFCRKGPGSIVRAPHRGLASATALGISYARGDVITIVDSDDVVLPHALSAVAPVFSDPAVGFAWSMFQLSSGRLGWSHPLPEGKTLYDAMMTGWWKAAHQRFFSKRWYERSPKLSTRFTRSIDYLLSLSIASTGCKSVHVPICTYWYRVNRPRSLTSEGAWKQKQETVQMQNWIKSIRR